MVRGHKLTAGGVWAPTGRGKRLPGNVIVFLCISSYSKTPNRPIVFALFWQSATGFWWLCPRSHRSSIDPTRRLSSSDPLICPHLEKILRASMGRRFTLKEWIVTWRPISWRPLFSHHPFRHHLITPKYALDYSLLHENSLVLHWCSIAACKT